MSTYELDDDMVRRILTAQRDGQPFAFGDLFAQLRVQVPTPTPTKLGAVVRTDKGVFVLADPGAELCWAQPISPQDSPDWFIDQAIGRITEVLSEGVDL